MGVTHATDVILTGCIFSADEAYHMGFLNAVFSPEEFQERVAEIASSIARTVSPIAALRFAGLGSARIDKIEAR